MKKNRLRLIALLLIAAVMLPLAACGTAETAPVEESEEPVSAPVETEPLEYHIYVEKEVLAKETVSAVSALPSDPGFVPAGPVLDRVTYWIYDLNGNAEQKIVYYSPDESVDRNFAALSERPEQNVLTASDGDKILCLYNFSFDEEGRLIREERESYADLSTGKALTSPVNDVFSFDEEGHIINWERKDGFSVSYEYDAGGELVTKSTETEEGIEVMKISRDATGKVTSTDVTHPDGLVATSKFVYDKAGNVTSEETVDGRRRTVLELYYGKDGWPSMMKVYINGARMRTERYSFEHVSDSLTVGKAKVEYTEADIFGGSTYSFSYPEQRENGSPEDSDSYTLSVVGTMIRYLKSSVRYGFEMVPIRSAAEKGSFEPIGSGDSFYPALGGSYGGHAVPKADGSRILRKVVVSSNLGEVIGNVTDIVLDQHDRAAGKISAFDLDSLKGLKKLKLDDDGRPVRTENNGLIAQYSYADDMLSYSVVGDIPEYAYHSENEYRLADRLPERILALKDNEVFSNVNYHLEYTGDGLLIRYGYPGIYEYAFEYDYETAPDGKLSAVTFSGDEVPEGSVFMSFDEHGYLTRYTRILEHEILTFEYFYVTAE